MSPSGYREYRASHAVAAGSSDVPFPLPPPITRWNFKKAQGTGEASGTPAAKPLDEPATLLDIFSPVREDYAALFNQYVREEPG